jgi:sucrose-6-phosphate hydrolase SacC (GH32 family)
MSLRFHACPLPRGWLNDPNALFHDSQAYQLLAQSRPDAPEFTRVDWGRLSSPDLLNWQWQGVAIAHDREEDVYSGSIRAQKDGYEGWYTANAPHGQFQRRMRSADGHHWTLGLERLEPPRRDWRDPFVFACPSGGWSMLLAAPCSWNDPSETSTLEVLHSDDGISDWQQTGVIGPWHPPGVLWEVPLLVPDPADPAKWLLIVSLMDRRTGGARCSVVCWHGTYDGKNFVRDDPADIDGTPLDCGPDFYAAMTRAAGAWPDADLVFTGWASSWETTRRFPWPGFHGGPIALPRRLTARGSAPLDRIVEAFTAHSKGVPTAGLGTASVGAAFDLRIGNENASLTLQVDTMNGLSVTRDGPDWLRWHQTFPPIHYADRKLTLFIDGPLIEIHIAPDDRWVTCALPANAEPFTVSLDGDQATAFNWRVLP